MFLGSFETEKAFSDVIKFIIGGGKAVKQMFNKTMVGMIFVMEEHHTHHKIAQYILPYRTSLKFFSVVLSVAEIKNV